MSPLHSFAGNDAPRVYMPDGIASLTYDKTAKTVTIEGRKKSFIMAPLATSLGVIDAVDPDHPFVQLTNYATVTTRMVIDDSLANTYIGNTDLQNHVMNSILSRIGRQIYGSPFTEGTATSATTDHFGHFNTISRFDSSGTLTDITAPAINIINYSTSSTHTTGGGLSVDVTAHVTPEMLELWKKDQEEAKARAFISAIRAKMRTVAIHIKRNTARKPITADHRVSAQELKARETLREMITESEYRRYITNGFIMVKAKSGLWYQIFSKQSGHWLFSFKDGKMFERLCIHTDAICPPTDHVINMKILAEIDEETLRKGANITTDYAKDPVYNNVIGDLKVSQAPKKEETLLELHRRMKAG